MQRFKENDPREEQVYNLFLPLLEELGVDRDTFLEGAFESYLFGDVLYDLDRDPLVGVITKDAYRISYPAIHDLFTAPGTFEFYLNLFRRIFGDDADIEFEIPGPGKLNIIVSALTLTQFNLTSREIVDGDYVYSQMITSDTSDKIMVQSVTGIKTQNEIDSLLAEISMYGIYTTVDLTTPED